MKTPYTKPPYVRAVNSFDYIYAFFYASIIGVVSLVISLFGYLELYHVAIGFFGGFLGYMIGVKYKYKKLNKSTEDKK